MPNGDLLVQGKVIRTRHRGEQGHWLDLGGSRRRTWAAAEGPRDQKNEGQL